MIKLAHGLSNPPRPDSIIGFVKLTTSPSAPLVSTLCNNKIHNLLQTLLRLLNGKNVLVTSFKRKNASTNLVRWIPTGNDDAPAGQLLLLSGDVLTVHGDHDGGQLGYNVQKEKRF